MADSTKNPADMSDEELDAIINGEELEEAEPAEAPEEQGENPETPKDEPAEADEEEAELEETKEVPEEESEEKPMSRRETLRVNQLLARLKESGGTPQEKETPEQTKPTGIKYEDELDADDETIKTLNADREKYGQDLYAQGRKEAEELKARQDAFEFRSMLTSEEPAVLRKYSFMDKDSDDFDNEATSAMVGKYLNFVGFDTDTNVAKNPMSYYEFVDSEMEFAQALAEKMTRESQTNLTKQVANTGLRPSGSAPSKGLNLSKAPEDMTDEELDAVISQSIPNRR